MHSAHPWIVGPVKCLVPFRLSAPHRPILHPSALSFTFQGECSYALKCSVKCLEFYNEFFGIPFPLPKVCFAAWTSASP